MTNYELIIDTDASDETHLAIAQAAAMLKEYHPDADIFDVDDHGGGRIGLHITSTIEATAEGPIVTVEEV